jgi:hypothetical protein
MVYLRRELRVFDSVVFAVSTVTGKVGGPGDPNGSQDRAAESLIRCDCTAGEDRRCLWLRMHQQIERDDVRNHQRGHVNDRDHVRTAQLPRYRRKAGLDGVVVVEDEVDSSHEIEGDDQQPKERTCVYRQDRQESQQPGCQVAVCGEGGEGSGQIRADHARKDKDEPEEAEAVQSSDSALRFNPVHRLEPGKNVHAEAK